jgi:hypothetical protein
MVPPPVSGGGGTADAVTPMTSRGAQTNVMRSVFVFMCLFPFILAVYSFLPKILRRVTKKMTATLLFLSADFTDGE